MAASPEDIEVEFSCSHAQTPVRLLELPPALLGLLAADPAPTLKIKAAPASADAADATAHHAVLCTPWQTFSLRHVHSSNSTFLVAPNAAPTAPGISAVSTETSYLELVATSPDTTALLQKHLIAYHGWAADDGDGDVAMLNTASTPPDTSAAPDKYALRDNLPMSNQEFDTAWRKTMAFEYRNTFYRPLPAAILQAIDALLLAAAAEKMPLTAPFEFTRLSAAVIEDQPEVPVELLHAVLSQICDEVPTTNEMVLVPSRCASFVGRCVLEDYWWNQQAKRNMHDLLYISFMGRWKGKVPEPCTSLCKLDLLKGWYKLPTPNTIAFVPGGTAADAPKPASTDASAAAKNKWHERLGKGKKR